MRPSALTAAAIVMASAFTLPAHAAKAVTCHALTDPVGDTLAAPEGTGAAPGSSLAPADPALDVISADIAGNRRDLTAVVRVTSLGAAAETSPLATSYVFSFQLREQHYSLQATRDLRTGSRIWLLNDNQAAGSDSIPVAGRFDARRNEVRMTAAYSDLAAFGEHVTATTVVGDLKAFTQRAVGTDGSYAFQNADGAASPTRVRLNAPSCVVVGS